MDAVRTAVFSGAEVQARGLALRGAHGWVYRDVSLRAAPGTLTVVAGEAGSGRTSLLLTLAGRMRPTEGTLSVAGRTTPRAIRRVAALGLFSEVNPFDDALSVREHLHERLRPHGFPWGGRRSGAVPAALGHAGLDPAALPAGDRTPARDLTRDQAVRLGVALALLDAPALLVVDDADTGIPAPKRLELWETLHGLARQGLTVVAACTDAAEARGLATTLLSLPTTAPPSATAPPPAESPSAESPSAESPTAVPAAAVPAADSGSARGEAESAVDAEGERR